MRRAIEAADVALWFWSLDTDRLVLDARACKQRGLSKSGANISCEDRSRRISPFDRDQVGDAFAATRERPGRFKIDFSILVGDEVLRLLAKAGETKRASSDGRDTGLF